MNNFFIIKTISNLYQYNRIVINEQAYFQVIVVVHSKLLVGDDPIIIIGT